MKSVFLLVICVLGSALSQQECSTSGVSGCGWPRISQGECLQRACCWNTNARYWCSYPVDFCNQGERYNCGVKGISERSCVERGCCWDSSPGGRYWCFHQEGYCNVKTRIACGLTGSESECFNLGCCWDNSVSNAPWCFHFAELFMDVDMRLENLQELSLGPNVVREQLVNNNSPEVLVSTLTLTEEITETSSFSRTQGFEIGVSTKFSAGIPFIGSTEWEISTKYSQEWTNGEVETTSRTITATHTCSIPAYSQASFQLISWRGEAQVPWVGTINFLDSSNATREVTGVWRGVDWGRDSVSCSVFRGYQKREFIEVLGLKTRIENQLTTSACEERCTEYADECIGFVRSNKLDDTELGDCALLNIKPTSDEDEPKVFSIGYSKDKTSWIAELFAEKI